MAVDGAEKNLQPAVATDVVESGPLLQRRVGDCAHQCAQSVYDELGRSARAGGRQDPFRFVSLSARFAQRLQRQPTGRREFDLNPGGVFVAVIDQRVGLRVARRRFQSGKLPYRRAEQDPTRATVEVNQRRGGFGHVAHEKNRRAPSEAREMSAEARRPLEAVEGQHVISRCDDPARAASLKATREVRRFRQGLLHREQ